MKWEAVLIQVPEGVVVEDLPVGWQPPRIGTSEEVQATLETAFPKGQHDDGHSAVEADGAEVEFIYAALDDGDDSVRIISVQCNGSLDTVPVLRSVSEHLDCRLFDLQTGQFADFGEQTEASMNAFVALRDRMKRERRWAFGLTVVVVVIFHALQDSGAIPAGKPSSKVVVGFYGFWGLILLNVFAFLSSVLAALWQARKLGDETESEDDKAKLEEAILVPAFEGAGNPPSLIARYFHIPVGIGFGMIAGAILAGLVSLLIR
jgi:hypothetical protein